MKIVDLERDTTSVQYQALWWLGVVAAVFSLVVSILMIANHVSLKRLDPVHSPALERLVEQLKANPQDDALKEEIRELDLLARRAFFNSQQFNRSAVFMLVGGLAVMVICFKVLRAYQPSPPHPVGPGSETTLADEARWARKSVTAVGLFLVGFALMLALPWRSPLNEVASDAATTTSVGSTASDAAAATTVVETFPTWEERLREWAVFLGDSGARARSLSGPTTWNMETGEGVVWQSEVPLPGFSSPIVWGNRVFMTGANDNNREVYCFDAESGTLLWTGKVDGFPGSPTKPPKVTEDTGHAAATMATDGTRVYAIFANGDLAAFDLDGHRSWAINLGVPGNPYGHSSSLVSFRDLVLVQMDRREDSFLAAYDGKTGAVKWKTMRDLGPSWASPRLIQTDEGPQLLLAADSLVASYDPENGNELWNLKCLEGAEVAPSPVYADGVVYVAADYVQFLAYDLAEQKIRWEQHEMIPGLGTPLVVNGGIFYGSADSGIFCLDVKTGELIWEARTDDGIYASPVLVGDRVYLVDRGGNVHIFKADTASHQPLETQSLGEEVVSTPAVTEAGFFVRGMNHLFRLQ